MTGWLRAAARVSVTPEAKAKSIEPAITALVEPIPVMDLLLHVETDILEDAGILRDIGGRENEGDGGERPASCARHRLARAAPARASAKAPAAT